MKQIYPHKPNSEDQNNSINEKREFLLTVEDEVNLIKHIQEGGDDVTAAKEKLIRANLRFVKAVAGRYVSEKYPMEELVKAGNIGLDYAIYRFDETHGFKFISYAIGWIRQSIFAYIVDQIINNNKSELNECELNNLKTFFGFGCKIDNIDISQAIDNLEVQRSIFIKNLGQEKFKLSLEDELDLVKQIKEADSNAKKRLKSEYHIIVESVAQQFVSEKYTIDVLIAEGNIGLEYAIDHFCETHGFKFISYAVWWIKLSIQVFMAEQALKNKYVKPEFSERQLDIIRMSLGLGCKKNYEELQSRYDLKPKRVVSIKNDVLQKFVIKSLPLATL
ncbi:MAG: sigma-70 family RNA polymerase sigma factor [Bacteroides sp.]|nr:sigma-70 family RNA polymerase sigma factor [Bacteroides sp.]